MRPVLLLIALLAALLAGLAATKLLIEPPAVRETTEPGQFDAKRAKARLATILAGERPHPADSAASDAVRSRLIGQIRALGLNPIVRDQLACNEFYKQRGVSCARVRNVIVALGPLGGKALLLSAHYDSNPTGPGAGDAGAGVASLLEVASILKAERLRRPVFFLFNEGEELGLIGARAFLKDPLSLRVDSLVNLEARGTTGPVTMFETNLPNGPALRAFSSAVDRPYANSLTTDVYRQMPNYTDVNSFSERGWLTLNFAMIGNETRYHSAGDNLAALDPRSLQHMGDQTLAVARELASASRPDGNGNLLFVDLAGRQLVMIPAWLGLVALVLLTAGFAWVAWRRGGIWRSLGIFLGGFVAAAALAWLCLYLMGMARPGSFWRGYPVWAHLALCSTGLLAAVTALALLGRRLAMKQLRAGFWLGFLILGLAMLPIAPGGIIYFLIPPLVAIAGIGLSRRLDWAERAGSIAAAFLLWLTFGEMMAFLTELLSNGPLLVFAPLALIIAMPWLIETKALVEEPGRLKAIGAAALVMLLGWGAAAAAPAYSADRQQKFTIYHVADPGEEKQWWAVNNDGAPLPATFGAGWERVKLPHMTGKDWGRPAPAIAGIEPPEVEVTGRGVAGENRVVRIRLRSNGQDRVALVAPKDAEIRGAGASGFVRPIAPDAKEGRYVISCTGRSCNGAELIIVTARPEPIETLVVGFRFALPSEGRPLAEARPKNARPQYLPDHIVALSRIAL